MSAAGNDNDNANDNNLIFTIKDTKLLVHLISEINPKLSNFLTKRFERSVYWNEYKTKNENKNTKNEYRYFLKSNFVGFNRLFVLVYSIKNDNSNRFKLKDIIYQNELLKVITSSSLEKIFMINQKNISYKT